MNGPTADYVPVACVFHERLEFAVLRRQRLRLRFLNESGSGEVDVVVLPVDVQTRDGAEWLHYRGEADEVQVVRLDRLLSAEPILP